MRTITLHNTFHGTSTTVRPDAQGIVSAATYRRARRELCPMQDCRCFSSEASGRDTLVLGQAEPIYAGGRIVSYRLAMPDEDVSAAASVMGRKGGAARSEAKTAAARENGKRGGRPVGTPQSEQTKRRISEARRKRNQ